MDRQPEAVEQTHDPDDAQDAREAEDAQRPLAGDVRRADAHVLAHDAHRGEDDQNAVIHIPKYVLPGSEESFSLSQRPKYELRRKECTDELHIVPHGVCGPVLN